MLNKNPEYERVLDNPEHVILSDELEDLLGESDVEKDEKHVFEGDSSIFFDGEEIIFLVKKIKRISSTNFVFSGYAPSFPLKKFLLGSKFSLRFFDFTFSLEENAPVKIDSSEILTFTARRIFNEEV